MVRAGSRITPAIRARARRIKLLAMDVDGVLTGGEIILLQSGEEVKIWSVKDRMGFALLHRSKLPIRLAWVTARKSRQVAERARDIGVDYLFQHCLDKWVAVRSLAKRLKISPAEVAYIGDDYVDLRPLRNAGLAVCPPESPELVKRTCHYQTRASAGRGVVREVIELLVQAQGAWKKALAPFALFLVLAGSAWGLSGCTSTQKSFQDSAEVPDQWVEKFTITETQSGLPVWILNSEVARVFNEKKKITLDDIRIQFLNPAPVKKGDSRKSIELARRSQSQAARLSAPKGEVGMDTRDLVAWGGVEVVAQDGTRLYTERLLYSTARQKIFTESPVKIVKKDSILIGEGMEASPDLETVRIFRHQAFLYPKNFPQNETPAHP